MTWITDGTGTYWVEPPLKVRRRAPRALRFADLRPGAILIHRSKSVMTHFEERDRFQAKGRDLPFANDDAKEVTTVTPTVGLALCTDRWFDPVAGQEDRLKGEMAGIRMISNHGLVGSKWPHTLRGLASQGYHWASDEQADRVRAFIAERSDLQDEWRAGRLTSEEARLRSTPWGTLLRELGLDA